MRLQLEESNELVESRLSRRFPATRASLHPGPSESPARLAPFCSESPACPGVGRPRSPGGRGQRGELRLQLGPEVTEGSELRHLIPEPWGGGGLPGQAGGGPPHPPAPRRPPSPG